MTVYRVTVQSVGRQWEATVHGAGVPSGVLARDLGDVEPRVLRLLSANGATAERTELEVEVRLPGVIEDSLFVVESLSDDLHREMDQAVAAMRELQIPEPDIARIVANRYQPPRPLAITNREIADHGLSRHPDAVGVRWDDHGFARTLKCRGCLEATLATYVDAPPGELNVLVYPAEPFECDLCHEGARVQHPTPDTQGDAR